MIKPTKWKVTRREAKTKEKGLPGTNPLVKLRKQPQQLLVTRHQRYALGTLYPAVCSQKCFLPFCGSC